jgi:hypothetical protein
MISKYLPFSDLCIKLRVETLGWAKFFSPFGSQTSRDFAAFRPVPKIAGRGFSF